MSRTKRQYAAYAKPGRPSEAEVIFEHASDKYDYAGLMQDRDGNWSLVALGFSANSVITRMRTACRKSGQWHSTYDVSMATSLARTWEVTAPVVRDYFGSHIVLMTAGFHPERGWEDWTDGDSARKAGKSRLRALAREGYTAVAFTQSGRTADFQMTELLASMNLRKKVEA